MGDRPVMDPLQRFEAEHDEALVALDRLDAAARALVEGREPASRLRVVREVLDILATAVRAHNENEERALFPLLEEEAPSHVFEEEHRMLRDLERQLGVALESDDAAVDVPPIAFSIVQILRDHIKRENEMLFPLARDVLGQDGLSRVAALLE